MEFIKKNITFIIGVSIPILMILFVAASIYLPGLFIQPKYNFLYVSGDDYNYYKQYSVQNGTLTRNETQLGKDVRLYICDVAKNKSKEVSFEEARKLNLDSNNVSPDGFEIVYGSRGDGLFSLFFYSSTDYSTHYIIGHNVSKKLNLQLSGSYYRNFRFIGWIK